MVAIVNAQSLWQYLSFLLVHLLLKCKNSYSFVSKETMLLSGTFYRQAIKTSLLFSPRLVASEHSTASWIFLFLFCLNIKYKTKQNKNQGLGRWSAWHIQVPVLHLVQSWNSHHWKRELTPLSCSLTSTWVSQHMCPLVCMTYIHA